MKKYLMFFAIPLGLAILANYKHEQYANEAAANSREDDFSLFFSDGPKSKDYTPNPSDQYAVWWERGYVFFGWPAGTTIWALVITFAVIAEQTMETRKAAEATVSASKASLKQARLARKALILQFRPKLIVRGGRVDFEKETMGIWITNIGGSKAYICTSHLKFDVFDKSDDGVAIPWNAGSADLVQRCSLRPRRNQNANLLSQHRSGCGNPRTIPKL